MVQSFEAIIDQYGALKILDPVELPRRRRVIITILDEEVPSTTSVEELETIPVVTKQSEIDSSSLPSSGIIAELLENPIQDPAFRPLTRDEIYDREL